MTSEPDVGPSRTEEPETPDVSVVVPADDEGDSLRATLGSIRSLDTGYAYEVIVVDGGRDEETPEIAREYDATLVSGPASGLAAARNEGARRADGEWLAFVGTGTELRANYLTAMLGYVEREGMAAASSYCRIDGPWRARLLEVTINGLFPRLETPILPAFNCVVHRRAFETVGGFPDVRDEGAAFSRELGATLPTGYCREVLVETSGGRVTAGGLAGTLWGYLGRSRLRPSG